MWTSIFLNIILSIIIIYLGHQLWNYLRDKYSVKKTIDLVNSQTQKYKQMVEEIQTAEIIKSENKDSENIDTNMEDELAIFIDSI